MIVKDANGFREATQAEIDFIGKTPRNLEAELDKLKADLRAKGVLL